ncbi:MAG: thiamine pyrophosphate-dependent enzyme [Actinomycetes bacterium]
MPARSGGRLVVDALAAHGVPRVFCVPGESFLPVLDALHDADVDTVVCRQEGGAAYMAEATGKLTGRPGVCVVTRGPGVSNSVVGLQTAWHDRTPLVLLAGTVPRGHRDRGAFQDIDLRGLLGATAKAVWTVDEAARVPELVARAFALACAGRSGPVVLGLPEDMLAETADVPDVAPYPAADEAVEVGGLDSLLAGAQRPLVVLGGPGWTGEARAAVQSWAERWRLPIAADFRCQDLVDNDSPSYVGPLGFGRDPRLSDQLAASDVLVTVGCRLGDVSTAGYTRPAVPASDMTLVEVSADADPVDAVYRPSLRLPVGPATFAAALGSSAPDAEPPWRAATEEARAQHEAWREPVPDGDEVDLGVVFRALRNRLPENALVTVGAGNHAVWAQRFLRYRTFRSQLGPRNGSMGYGVPAGVAACLAHPDRQVVTVAGDGCFLMNGQELATARAYGLAPVVLVLNNGQYATIRAHQERAFPGRVSGTALTNPDFAAYARAFGGHGEVVSRTDEVDGALDRAFAAGLPAVVDLRVSADRLGPGVTVADVRP